MAITKKTIEQIAQENAKKANKAKNSETKNSEQEGNVQLEKKSNIIL